MFSSFRKKIKYLEEVSLNKAILFLAIVPLTVIMLSANFLSNSYADLILTYSVMITYPFLVGKSELLLKPSMSFKKNIQIVTYILIASAFLTWAGVKIVGSDNPQGLNDVVYTGKQYLKLNSLLPLIGFGEEFLCAFTFIGLFSLLPGGRLRKFLFSLIGASVIFGLMHAFHSPFTAILGIAMGHVPFIFATFYYRSILPAVISHIIWDGMNFFGHFNKDLYTLFFIVLTLTYTVYKLIPKKKVMPN